MHSMPVLSDLLAAHPHARRFAPPRVEGGRGSLVVDATGLSAVERGALEGDLRALFAQAGVPDARIAMTAERTTRRLLAVGSGKGGVGKSTLAANLAVALGRAGTPTGLVDADITGPSVPTLLGMTGRPEARGKQLIPLRAHGIQALSMGALTPPGRALAWRGPMVAGALGQLLEADWGEAELLVVDLPPGTGDIHLSLLQKHRPAGAVVVTTPQDLSLQDAARALDLFGQVGVPVLGIVENMAGYACPGCGALSDPFGRGGGEREAAARGVPFLGRVPLDIAVRKASDAGDPPASAPGPIGDVFRELASRVLAGLNQSAG